MSPSAVYAIAMFPRPSTLSTLSVSPLFARVSRAIYSIFAGVGGIYSRPFVKVDCLLPASVLLHCLLWALILGFQGSSFGWLAGGEGLVGLPSRLLAGLFPSRLLASVPETPSFSGVGGRTIAYYVYKLALSSRPLRRPGDTPDTYGV